MKITIISNSAAFPWGMAASSRVKHLAKGLICQGHSVQYIGLRGANTSHTKDKRRKGCVEGIPFIYPGFFAVRSKNWFLRRLDDWLGKWLSFCYVLNLRLLKKVDLIVLYTRNYKVVRFWSLIAKFLSITLLLEICEWPAVNNKENSANRNLFCEKAPLLVDGVLPISQFIENKVKELSKRFGTQIPSFKIPILIDVEQFISNEASSDAPELYLLYAGSFSYLDIAMLIVDTILLLKKQGYNYKMLMTGETKGDHYNQLLEYVRWHCLEDLIHFTGFLEEDILIDKMINASLLLAPVPDDLQTEARFPTKLGYYLASETPIITNPFGEIQHYLTDHETAIFLETFTAECLKDKIIYTMDNQNTIQSIGIKGKELAIKNFDYRHALKDFNKFISQIEK